MSEKSKPRYLEIAEAFGIIIPGWGILDYFEEAVINHGYETAVIHGTQGSGKSNRMLQYGKGIAERVLEEEDDDELWSFVLDHVVFKPSEFVERLEAVPRDNRLPFILWDDIGVHYTSSTFKTDIQQYSAVDSTWTAIRTKVAVVIVTIPVLGRLAKNVKDNLTFECFLGRNQLEQVRRLFYLPGTKHLESNMFKPELDQPSYMDLYKIPEWVWKKYWGMRLDLTESALARLRGATDMEDTANYTPIWDIAKTLSVSANTLQQMGSRGLIPTQMINGKLCVPNDFIPELELEYSR